MAPPGEIGPDESIVYRMLGPLIPVHTLCALLLGMRLYTHARPMRHLGWDDGAAALAMVRFPALKHNKLRRNVGHIQRLTKGVLRLPVRHNSLSSSQPFRSASADIISTSLTMTKSGPVGCSSSASSPGAGLSHSERSASRFSSFASRQGGHGRSFSTS